MKKLGLALSSGGARGFAHIGVIKVLEKHNLPIDFIAGTSMGAVIAAYYALYGEIKGIEKIARDFRKRDVLKLVDLNNPKISLIKGKNVRKFVESVFKDKTFADTKIPLRIGATALEDGSKVVFKEGKIIDAVMASGSFPGVFPPVEYKGKHLIDGGIADATPVDLVGDMGAEIIVAVDLFLTHAENKEKYEMRDVIERVYELIMSNLSKYSEKEFGDNILVLKPSAGRRIDTFAFYNADKYIASGEKEAEAHISKLKKMLK